MPFDASTLNAFSAGFNVFGSVFGALTSLDEGAAERRAAEYRAAQLRVNAGQAQAGAQREAITADEQAKRIASRALAVAAASGGGASDPTVVNIIAGIAGEGAYRKALALYQGDERARALLQQADTSEYEGKIAEIGAQRDAFGKLVGAGSSTVRGIARGQSLYEKYGGGGPAASARPASQVGMEY